jgi:hypothetical protein
MRTPKTLRPAKLVDLRHATAFGLFAVWYLLTPPFVSGDPPGRLQLNAPLSRWSQMDSSDSASDCDEQRNNMVRMYRSGDMTSMGDPVQTLTLPQLCMRLLGRPAPEGIRQAD